MDEPRIGETRMYIQPSGQQHKQVFAECPVCHKGKWSYLGHGIPLHSTHKSCSGFSGWNKPESKKNHSKAQTKRWSKEEEREHQKQKMIEWHKIKNTLPKHKRSLKTRKQMSLSALKAYENPEIRMKHNIATTNRYKDPAEHEKTSQRNYKRYEDLKAHEVTSKANTVRWSSRERRSQQAEAMVKVWKDDEYKDRVMAKTMKSAQISPNLSETIVGNMLNEFFPNQWEYVGDGKLIIGGKNPDYVHNNGSKLAIECFGTYWHNPKLNKKLKYHQTAEGRVEFLANYGYRTLILWERDIKSLPNVKLAEMVSAFVASK